jgi:hypothetical protein
VQYLSGDDNNSYANDDNDARGDNDENRDDQYIDGACDHNGVVGSVYIRL